MRPTKKIETEILDVYDTWLQSYLNGDVKTYDFFLDDDYHFIGSASKEEFLNRKDTTQFFADTGEQFAGKTEIRNESKTIEQFGELIFITHVLDAWFLNKGEWNFYSRFRFTSVLRKNKDGWRFIYQHFSIPDPKTAEGETIGYDKINEENQELREAIQRRTFELEEKNRELKVEGALERIRAQAVAMKASEDLLDIVVTMRNEFIKLGHDAHYFWHMMWLPETYEKAMTSGDGSRIGFVMTLPRHIHGGIPLLSKWEKSKRPTVVYAMDVDEAIDYVDKMIILGDFRNIDPQAPSHDDIRHIGGLTFIMARTSHGEIGYSLPGIVKNPPKQDLDILVQFAGAFDLAHRRFLDLQKAEQQSREVEIELALEKVRSRTMAMQKSEELSEASFLLDAQVRELGIKTWGCAFNIYGEGESKEWFGNEKGELTTYSVPRRGIFKDYYDKGHEGETLLVREFSGDDCVAHYEFMSTLPGIGDVLKQLKKTNNGFPTYQIDHVVYFKYGYLLFITRESVPEAHDIFKRFAKVFEQTYTRFLDLQKAEAQAREAQIEAALERVRAQSMAMHSSSELQDVIRVIFDQMSQININAEHAGIVVDYEPKKDFNFWIAEHQDLPAKITVPYLNLIWDRQFAKAKKTGAELFTTLLSFEEKNDFYATLLPHIEGITPEMQTRYFERQGLAISTAVQKDIGLYIENFEGIPYSDEENDILLRFAKVFQQTYTRFLDLQKAEAQAREAQIEAALEKVRSRSLAVHNSEEFKEVVSIVFEKLKELQIPATAVGIGVRIQGSKDLKSYVCGENEAGLVITNYRLPYFNNKISKDLCNAFDKESNLFKGHYSKKVKDTFYKYILDKTSEFKDLPEDILSMIFNSQSYTITMVTSDQVVFNINDFEGNDLTEHEINILKRFSRVFNQAYIRFLDLQKAEAQARESQINLAVERVRARALAMHKSEEIIEVVAKLKDEVMGLEIPKIVAATIFLEAENNTIRMWDLSSLERTDQGYLAITDITFKLKKKDPHLYIKRVWENPGDYFVDIQNSKDLDRIIEFMYENNQHEIAKEVEDYTKATNLMTLYHASKQLNNGKLCIDLLESPPEEMQTILNKMGAAFDLAYKRFEDIEKAEAQAREAQIEAALEKIRSRSLAMHKPEELQEVVAVVAEKLQELGVIYDAGGVILCTYFPDSKDVVHWITVDDFSSSGRYFLPYFDNPIFNDAWDSKTKGDAYFSQEFTVEAKNAFFKHAFENSDYSQMPKDYKQFVLKADQHHLSAAWSKNSAIIIPSLTGVVPSESDADILKRFARVFEQAYIRFLDLEKAEAQAREAQIEVSLERVRARAMAMHQTDELTDVLCVLFDQFDILGINPVLTHLTLFDEENETFSLRITTTAENRIVAEQYIDINAVDAWKDSFENWKKSEPNAVNCIDYEPEIIPVVFDLLSEVMNALPKGHRIYPKDFPDGLYTTQGHFKFGYIGFNHSRKATEEEKEIVVRFAKEFGRTYQRFLDIEKAEAQTREAQIEAALEKVRSRSLAMHQTTEMQQVANEVHDQLLNLGLDIDALAMSGVIKNKTDYDVWVGGENYEKPLRITFNRDTKVQRDYNKVIKERPELFTKTYKGKTKDAYFKHLMATNTFKPKHKKMMLECSAFTTSLTFMKNSGLQIVRYNDQAFTDDENTIVKRFGRVFEQAYIRFLDLEKAEAQTREAQIEMSLEKVRSRTMAMQTSSELPEAANTLFLEVQALGIPAWSAGYCIWNADKRLANCNMSSEGEIQKGFMLPTIGEGYDFETPLKKGDKFHVASLGGKELVKHYEFMKTLPGVGEILSKLVNSGLELPTFQIFHICYFKHGYVMFITYEPVPNAHDIFKRFSAVFEQTYTRFLDLERAEAQTREAQIEMALEKVRSRTMAMQKGEELQDVVVLLYKELIKLGVTNFVTCGYVEINEATQRQSTWVTNPGGDSLGLFHLPLTGDATFDARYKAWREQQEVFHQTVAGKVRQKHLEYAITTFNSKEAEKMVLSQFPDPTVFYCFNFPQGYLHIVSGSRLDKDEENLMARFTRVFEQTYTRFLDLERAEAQAREAQVEMALEKVRSRTMAMQHSAELKDAAQVLFNEVQNLGIPSWSCGYNILSEDKTSAECYMSSEGALQKPFTLYYDQEKSFIEQYNFFKSKKTFLVQEQKGKDLEEAYAYMKTIPRIGEIITDLEEEGISLPMHQFNHLCKFNKGYLLFITYEQVPEAHDLFVRFTKVFEQTYTRFLDLKKAEAQAREAKIETALERVRSQSMSMQRSEELSTTTQVFHQQLQLLGIDSEFSYLWLPEEDEKHQVFWATWSQNHNNHNDYQTKKVRYPLDKSEPSIAACYAAWESEEPVHVNVVKPEEVEDYFNTWSELLSGVDKFQPKLFQEGLYYIDAYMSYGCFGIMVKQSLSDNEKTILNRFSKEFQRTYTRFLDLQKAEAQAREAQIEAALERIRSHSMGMQATSDFAEVTTEMFNQLRNFGEDLFATGIVFCDKHEGHVEQWHSIPGGGMLSPMIVPIDLDYIHQYRYDQWKAGKDLFSIEIPSDFIEQHFEDIFKLPSAQVTLKDLEARNAPMPAPPPWEIDYGASFKNGYLLISSLKPLENTDILPRFAKVFEQAYTRFLDLQTAEKNAYKSRVETALERVRARALAMQEPDELRDVASVLRTEMGLLGIEELETSSIYILDDDVSNAECWYAIKDAKSKSKKLISDHISMDFTKTWVGKQMLNFHDSDNDTASIAMKGAQRKEWIYYCAEQSKALQTYYGDDIPERTYHLHKFSNGAIGAAAAGDISEESWVLLKRCASVFSLAYSRFKDLTQAKIDLKRLKTEKKRAEEALSELQTTQKQLIQSEKMASLGELTAGIAHEIQNPLNFVNNFSEVSKELLEEMQEEIENGDLEEVKAIMQDIVQNLEKINHHGQRADSIVKGMLQHSRASGHKKEPTDINALADEYLRLAYHGLRAKDKSFNADLVADFDNSVESLNVIPQDIGRVILNLLTNAFYVVNERKKTDGKDYKPTVKISTKRHKKSIEISVEDNGKGMPDSVKDKIFQPFFTTKPTGEGTGLGLSMSYDIITKGHGGELKVSTTEGEGTTFCISLPIKETL